MLDFSEKFHSMGAVSSPFKNSSENLRQIQIDFLKRFVFDNPELEKLHCFRHYSEERLQNLATDIKENGILSHITVRWKADNLYEILAGRNRCEAARLAGLQNISCLVKKTDNNQAIIIMTSTNLNQRQELLSSEKAFGYKSQLEALKHTKHRVDAAEKIASDVKESRRQIFRLIRLTHLIPELLQKVDNKTLQLSSGVSLSYLSKDVQTTINSFCESKRVKLNMELCERFKSEFATVDKIGEEDLQNLISNQSKKKSESVSVKIPKNIFLELFGDISKAEAEKQVIFLLTNQLNNAK